jgi:hypothetical protein
MWPEWIRYDPTRSVRDHYAKSEMGWLERTLVGFDDENAHRAITTLIAS